MSYSYWFYLKNIFINPNKAARAILEESQLKQIALISFLFGSFSYILITLWGYQVIGWGDFPYRDYYPYYFSPYWWEVFLNPIWGAVIAFGYGLPCYYFGKLFGGKGAFWQVFAFVLLASIVSLPIFILVDAYRFVYLPELVIAFAKHGPAGIAPSAYPNNLVYIIDTSYAYVTMTWQGIVTVAGLSIIHKIRWYKNVPAIVAGSVIFTIFILLIRDYVALIA